MASTWASSATSACSDQRAPAGGAHLRGHALGGCSVGRVVDRHVPAVTGRQHGRRGADAVDHGGSRDDQRSSSSCLTWTPPVWQASFEVLTWRIRLRSYIRPTGAVGASPPLALMVIREAGAHLLWRALHALHAFSFTRPAVRPLCHHFIDSTHALFAASTPIAVVDLRSHRLRGTAPGLGALPIPLIRPAMGNDRPGRACHLVGQRHHHHVRRPAHQQLLAATWACPWRARSPRARRG